MFIQDGRGIETSHCFFFRRFQTSDVVNSKPFFFLKFCIIFSMKDAKQKSKSSKIIILTGGEPPQKSQNG